MAILIPLSSTKPNCSSDITPFACPLILHSSIFKISLVMWLMRPVVRCSSQFAVPGFLGKAMNVDLLISSGK